MSYTKTSICTLFENFRKANSIPFIIEVLGTPNSGKTSAIQTFEKVLKRSNVKYKIIYEGASRCKIKDKLSPNFNFWTLSDTMKLLLETFESNYDLVICERGLLDSICWCNMFYKTNKLTEQEYNSVVQYINSPHFFSHINSFYIFKCDANTAIQRENLDDLLDIKGAIVNEKVLNQYNASLEEVYNEFACKSLCKVFDTSNMQQIEINKTFANSIIEHIKSLS